MRARRLGGRYEDYYPGGVPNRFEPEPLERRGQKGGMLETIASAPGLDQFRRQAFRVEPHLATEQNVEVSMDCAPYGH